MGQSFFLIYTMSQTLLLATRFVSLQKSLLWNIHPIASLLAANRDLGVGEDMQGVDSPQPFLLTLHFVLFSVSALLILQILKL